MPRQYGVPSSHMFCDQWPSGFLGHLQVPQHPPDLLVRTNGDQATRRLDEVAGPHQVIAAQIVIRFGESPRNRQAGDDAAFHAFGLVRAHDCGAGVVQRRPFLGRNAPSELRMPLRPPADVRVSGSVEVLEQADKGMLPGLHRGGTEPQCHHERTVRRLKVDLAGQGHVAVHCARVVLLQAFVRLQLLPAVREADEADRSREPRR